MQGQDFRNLLDKLETVKNTVNITEEWLKWGKFLKEAEQTKTKTKTKVKPDIFKSAEKGEIQANEPAEKSGPKRKRSKQVTLKKSVPVPDLSRIDKTIGKADSDDDYGDLEMNAPRLDTTPTLSLGQDVDTNTTDLAVNTPSKKETEIAQRVHNVEWHNMMDLPGNMHQVIRNMGRRVFSAFGEQDFEDIDVIASITNNEEDLDTVAGLVRQFGVPVVKDNVVDFGDTIPGYKAYAGVWAFANQYYMFVKDDFGEYIYAWDNTETDKLQHFEPINNKDQARLEGLNESRNAFMGPVANDPLMNVSYKGYTYDPEVETDDDSRKLIHHITNPQGEWHGVAPSWFENISPYEYPTAEEFKQAVNEIETSKT